jgi:hypothetical protein
VSSSDKIKDALVAAYPGTSSKEWKRRSKEKVGLAVHRKFDHPDHPEVLTVEDSDGGVSVTAPLLSGDVSNADMAEEIKTAIGKLCEPPKVDLGPIEIGDKVQIAAGTEVFEVDYHGARGSESSKRVITATVSDIIEQPANWLAFAPVEHRKAVGAAMAAVGARTTDVRHLLNWISSEQKNVTRGFTGWEREPKYSNNPLIAASLMKAQEAYREAYPEARFVQWGKHKAAYIGSVTKTASKEAVKAAKDIAPKEAKITKRRLMVEKSKWRFTQDVEVTRWIENPKIDELCAQRNAISRSGNSQHLVGRTMVVTLGGGNPNTPAEKQQIEAIQLQINKLSRDEPSILVKQGIIPAGTEFTVTGKISSDGAGYRRKSNGLMVPVAVTKGTLNAVPRAFHSRWGSGMQFPYSQIEAAVEPLEVPETIVYVLRDAKTGEFYAGMENDRRKMAKTFSGAKKYKTSAAAKASIRDFTGYNSGINDEGEYAPEWATGGDKRFDLPSTWEMVAIDKTTNTEKEVIDVQEWFKGLMRLRVLTQKHCSAVRAAYKKAEDDETNSYEAILLFQNREIGSSSWTNRSGQTVKSEWDNASPWEDDSDGGKAALAAIKAATDNMSERKIRVKTQSAVAYACSLDDAVMAKMMFNHEGVIIRLLDITTLEEVVAETPVVSRIAASE